MPCDHGIDGDDDCLCWPR